MQSGWYFMILLFHLMPSKLQQQIYVWRDTFDILCIGEKIERQIMEQRPAVH